MMFGISISYYVDKAIGRKYIYNYLFETLLVGIKSVGLKVKILVVTIIENHNIEQQKNRKNRDIQRYF